jgi:hypothetical protein
MELRAFCSRIENDDIRDDHAHAHDHDRDDDDDDDDDCEKRNDTMIEKIFEKDRTKSLSKSSKGVSD